MWTISPFSATIRRSLPLRDRQFLVEARPAIEKYLEQLRLRIHPVKSQLFETRYGANFMGFRIFPERIRVRNDNLRRARRRLHQLQQDYAQGKVSLEKLIQRLQSWDAHLKHGDTYRLRRSVFDYWTFSRSDEVNNPESSQDF